MSSSGDSSPDWLRSFQAPTHSPVTLSSDSGSLHDSGSFSDEHRIDDDDEELTPKSSKIAKVKKSKSTAIGGSSAKSSSKKTLEATSLKVEDQTPSRRKKLDTQKEKNGKNEEKKITDESDIDKQTEHKEPIHSIWALSSDSESFHDHIPKTEDHIDQVETSQPQIFQPPGEGECGDGLLPDNNQKSPSKKASEKKSSQKQIDVEGSTPVKEKKTKGNTNGKLSENGAGGDGDVEIEEDETFEKPVERNVSSSMLPLMLSEKVHRTKALVECQGDSIDLSGDMGAVGRIIISDSPSGDPEMCLDLKGTIYKTTIVPCRTFCVVSFGQSEAKIEAIMNDFIQLNPQSNVYEAETMVEGTLDGFSFDSDEEAGKTQKATHPTDQNEHAEEQPHGKSKRKADKTSGAEKKRGRITGGKSQPKIAKKKAPTAKRAKTKK